MPLSSVMSSERGKSIISHVFKNIFEILFFMGSTLTELQTKCGSMKDAHDVFFEIPEHNMLSWRTMIVGY